MRRYSRRWPRSASRSDAGGTTTLAARMEDLVRVRLHLRRDLALRYAEGSAPAPVATTAQPGKSNRQGELWIG